LVGGYDGSISRAVLVATSELVTNVIRHTGGGGTLRAWEPHSNTPLRVEVEDDDPAVPVLRTPADGGQGGHGLTIVAGLSSGWGVQPTRAGKIVWAEFESSDV
jgi:anti-sigma regulatory factor (Ser/Thr protein kinase)